MESYSLILLNKILSTVFFWKILIKSLAGEIRTPQRISDIIIFRKCSNLYNLCSFWLDYFFRINDPLQNFAKFAESFHCKPGTPMNPENKCSLWWWNLVSNCFAAYVDHKTCCMQQQQRFLGLYKYWNVDASTFQDDEASILSKT